jgi:hypothetical protein
MDVFGATVSVNQDGAAVTAVVSPFSSWLPSDAFLSDLRVQLDAGGSKQQWGGGVSFDLLGNVELKLQVKDEKVKELVGRCEEKVSRKRRLVDPVKARVGELLALLPADALDPRTRDQGEKLDAYGGRVIAAWNRRAATADPVTRVKGDDVRDGLQQALESYRTALGDCAEQGLRAARWAQVYDNGYFVRVKGAAHAFPHVDGPSVLVNGTWTRPAPNTLADCSASVHVAYFPNPIFGIWLSGGYARTRPTSQTDAFPERLSAGLDLAWNVYAEDRKDDGFQPGIAVGGYARWSRCLASAGCGESLPEYSDPLPTARVQTYGAFVDVRVSTKLQLRLAVPVDRYRLTRAPSPDGTLEVRRVVPTLSVTVASWGA